MTMRGHFFSIFLLISLTFAQHLIAQSAASGSQTPDAHTVPSLDGGIGSCSADFIINDDAGKPIYNATIKVHIAYGTWSVRKLDLQINTNVDGKARFTGLPDRLKRGLYFEASESDRSAEAFDDPEKTCQAQFTVALQKKPQ
jgi:hypothetical protein